MSKNSIVLRCFGESLEPGIGGVVGKSRRTKEDNEHLTLPSASIKEKYQWQNLKRKEVYFTVLKVGKSNSMTLTSCKSPCIHHNMAEKQECIKQKQALKPNSPTQGLAHSWRQSP